MIFDLKRHFSERSKIRFLRQNAKNLRNLSDTYPQKMPKTPKKITKKGFYVNKNAILFHWYTNSYKEKAEKVKKSAKRWMYVMEKFYFCNPKRQRYGTARERGVVNRGMFIERMEECSKYSRRGIWDSQAMRPGQTKK